MPPYPALYGDTAIPGAAAAATTTALHTHSSKFPIEREVILSSVDKNSKIPILHEYKKQRPKSASSATIAPEGPNKQVAWMENKKTTITTAHPMQVVQDSGRGPKPQLEYRSQFHGPDTQYLYNGYHGAVSTGAIPRTWRTDSDQTTTGRIPASLPQADPDGMKQEDDDADKNKAFPARTYHTIKDMISSRFGSGKATKEGESTLNNASGSVIHKDDDYQRPQNGIYIVMRQPPESSNYGTPNTILAKVQSRRGSQSRLDEDDDEGGFLTGGGSGAKTLRSSNRSGGGQQQSSSQSSDYEKATQRSTGQSSSNADSGRGSTIYSGAHQAAQASEHLNTSTESSDSPQTTGRDVLYGMPTAVDVVETELRQILDPELHGLGRTGANSTLSESISSLTPPLPPLSPGGGSSPSVSPQNSTRYKHGSRKAPPGGSGGGKSRNVILPGSRGGWNSRQSAPEKHRQSSKKNEPFMSSKTPLSASVFGLDTTDLTSTTTGLDSVLDGNTENNSSDDDLSTTIDTTDAHAIRKQLEGLENMYSEVLKLLGVKKYSGRYQPSDPRINKRRLYGSMSSLPSSVSSRPIRDRRKQDERKKVKDIKGINKRFQRLESHVVTLARSVAHLSSEMRTQHLMIQEMENIRGEISALRSQTLAVRSQSMPRGLNNVLPPGERDSLTNPTRVKKLTKFFGDEPPLLRLFLKKLGYEKYAGIFEQERVGMVELPYLTEERLQKMGIPLGPRLRILQEAQISVCRDKIYVV